MPQMLMKHDRDPREELWGKVGDDLSKITHLFHSQVLVAVYVRSKQTTTGVYLPDSITDEDIYQGKVGLIVKMGPLAFQDTTDVKFYGQKAEIGDWVVFRSSDGWPLDIGKTRYRVLSDTAVRAVVDRPDLIF